MNILCTYCKEPLVEIISQKFSCKNNYVSCKNNYGCCCTLFVNNDNNIVYYENIIEVSNNLYKIFAYDFYGFNSSCKTVIFKYIKTDYPDLSTENLLDRETILEISNFFPINLTEDLSSQISNIINKLLKLKVFA
jgi:hypothetical protein